MTRIAILAALAGFGVLGTGCATPERRLLATLTSLAHHEHLGTLQTECRLKQTGIDTFDFECLGAPAVTVRCTISRAEECCWVPGPEDSLTVEDQKCEARRRVARRMHAPH